jgi:succinate dehydrogenase / fumarate reductase, cytochrome b subunit
VKQQRPVNLDLTKYRFPRMAIVSILHRISGVLIFIFLPVMLYILHQSLISQTNFDAIHAQLMRPTLKIILWVALSAVFFHLIAGIRHLIMDCGFFETWKAGKTTATLVMILSALSIILIGVWLW